MINDDKLINQQHIYFYGPIFHGIHVDQVSGSPSGSFTR